MRAYLAYPGDLTLPTGGYVYDRRVIEASNGGLAPLGLPDLHPTPSDAALGETAAILTEAMKEAARPVLIDGLAYAHLPPRLIAALPQKPIALCHHPLGLEEGLSPEEAARLIEAEKAALAAACHVVVTSETTKATLLADFGLGKSDVTVAAPGLERHPPAAGSAATPMAGTPEILTIASIIPRKGHDTLIAALARIKDRNWICRLVGPDDRAPDWAAKIRADIRKAGLEERVLITGPQTSDALNVLYHGADIFALPSRYEGYGMVFSEAMMRGLPIIACRAGAAPEVIGEEAGILVPVGADAALAEALAALLDEPAERAQRGAAGRRRAHTFPGWETTWAIIRDALSQGRRE